MNPALFLNSVIILAAPTRVAEALRLLYIVPGIGVGFFCQLLTCLGFCAWIDVTETTVPVVTASPRSRTG